MRFRARPSSRCASWEFDIGWSAIKLFEKFGLAKVLRVAPSLDVRPNIAMPDSETLKALLAIRFQAMTDYYRCVTLPALREEAAAAGASARALLPRKLRKGLADGGRWLDDDTQARLQAWLAERPRMATLADYRPRLAQVLDERSNDAQATLQKLHAWCAEAEASGIQALQAFSARMKGYALGAGADPTGACGSRVARWRAFAALLPLACGAIAQVRASSDYLRHGQRRDGRVALAEYQDWMGYAFDAHGPRRRWRAVAGRVARRPWQAGDSGRAPRVAGGRVPRQDGNRDGALSARSWRRHRSDLRGRHASMKI